MTELGAFLDHLSPDLNEPFLHAATRQRDNRDDVSFFASFESGILSGTSATGG